MNSYIRNNPIQLFVATVLGLLLFSTAMAENISGPAPDFTLKSNRGKNIKLSELRGQVVLLNFWASWCGPCRQEMPLLEKLYQRYQPLGFTLLGINVEEDTRQAKTLLKDVKVSFPILFDNKNSVSERYDISAMPSTILVDRDGNMRYLHKGYKAGDEATYRKWVKSLLKE